MFAITNYYSYLCNVKHLKQTIMKRLIFIMCALFALVASTDAQTYRDDPVYQQHLRNYRNYQKKNLPANYRFQTQQQLDAHEYATRQMTGLPYTQASEMSAQIAELNNKLDMMSKKLSQGTKQMRSPGDCLVLSGRWEKATFWTGILGSAAAGGLYYYSTTDGCKDSKAFKTAAIATAGATALIAFTCWMTKVHYKIKAGKRLNMSMGAAGAELTYNF